MLLANWVFEQIGTSGGDCAMARVHVQLLAMRVDVAGAARQH